MTLNCVITAAELAKRASNSQLNRFVSVFLKGGKFYYAPLGENLKAFDSQLLTQKNLSGTAEPFEEIDKSDHAVELDKFDSNLVNASQFVNLVNNFIHASFLKSEIFVNDLIKFIKDNYFESQSERTGKLEKVRPTTRLPDDHQLAVKPEPSSHLLRHKRRAETRREGPNLASASSAWTTRAAWLSTLTS